MNKAILLVFLLSIFYSSCQDDLKQIEGKFGVGGNDVREKLHLVAVDPTFKVKEDLSVEGRRYIFVNKHEPDITKSEYLVKIILLDSSRQYIISEEDHFKNPIEGKYLVVHHSYIDNSTNIDLQTISENINNKANSLNSNQADSVLKTWRISLNPF
jgi:hypothetical protein